MKTIRMEHPRVGSRAEWLAARKALLIKEKNHTRQGDALAAERRELPWVRVEKDYVFDAPGGSETLVELFEGRSQLIVQHFIFWPGWNEACASSSLLADHVDGALVHLAQRDVTFVAVSRAPFAQIDAFRKRMGWGFRWVSSDGNDFNHDYRMDELVAEEAPGISVFCKDAAGDVFHTYSTYARGSEPLLGTYMFLDLVPKGRDEAGVPFTMDWVRHHDR